MPLRPSLIVHGGAWAIPKQSVAACHNGIRNSLEVGWKILCAGGSAADAVEAGIVVLEEDPIFDAGYGSHLTLDGRVQLDAILMDGSTLKAGAVAAVERVRNPIRLARCILEKSKHILLVGEGAEQFAQENGLLLCDPDELITEQERAAWRLCREDSHSAEHHANRAQGTVGAVAVDSRGGIFAGTSTGGTCCKYAGRVGDSPLIGCGCYADAEVGGVSCTGNGEGIMKIVMAKMAIDLLAEPPEAPYRLQPRPEGSQSEHNHAQFVADACIRKLAHRSHTTGGLILLDRDGTPAASFNTPHMSHGFVKPDGTFHISP
jgi:L-asparaginase / beta-aspartyl-peptidase